MIEENMVKGDSVKASLENALDAGEGLLRRVHGVRFRRCRGEVAGGRGLVVEEQHVAELHRGWHEDLAARVRGVAAEWAGGAGQPATIP